MKKPLIFLLLLISMLVSCQKEDQVSYKELNAVILNSKETAVDGCGWLIKMDDTENVYSPVNMPNLFKTDSLEVTISYNLLTTKSSCGIIPGDGVTQMHIVAIRKKGVAGLK